MAVDPKIFMVAGLGALFLLMSRKDSQPSSPFVQGEASFPTREPTRTTERQPPNEGLRNLQTVLNEFRQQVITTASNPFMNIVDFPEIFSGGGCSSPGALTEDGYWGPCTANALATWDAIARGVGYEYVFDNIDTNPDSMAGAINTIYSVIDDMVDDPHIARDVVEMARRYRTANV
jgi:hypothetical protein